MNRAYRALILAVGRPIMIRVTISVTVQCGLADIQHLDLTSSPDALVVA